MSIEIIRTDPKNVQNYCLLCATPQKVWNTHAIYTITPEGGDEEISRTQQEELIFCPYHELMFMEKMINNLAKRLARPGGGNPKAVLPRKENEDESRNDAVVASS